jgi:hypothetical protein
MMASLAAIREALRDCLAWCERIRVAPPPHHAAYLAEEPWPYNDSGFSFQAHPDSIAAAVRSRELADAALRFLPASAQEIYGPAYRVEPWPDAPPATAAAFDRFVQVRRHLQNGRVPHPSLAEAEVEQELGRLQALVLTDWQRTVWDSASAFVSAGFFDLHDVPGWDTWLGLIELPPSSVDGLPERWLVSWVPLWARPLVAEAIRVNPVACLAWGTVSTAGEITAPTWSR